MDEVVTACPSTCEGPVGKSKSERVLDDRDIVAFCSDTGEDPRQAEKWLWDADGDVEVTADCDPTLTVVGNMEVSGERPKLIRLRYVEICSCSKPVTSI